MAWGDEDVPTAVDLHLVEAAAVKTALQEAYSALTPEKKAAKGTFPVWISIHKVDAGRRAAGSGVAAQAVDRLLGVEIDGLGLESKAPVPDSVESPSQEHPASSELLSLKAAIARRLGRQSGLLVANFAASALGAPPGATITAT